MQISNSTKPTWITGIIYICKFCGGFTDRSEILEMYHCPCCGTEMYKCSICNELTHR